MIEIDKELFKDQVKECIEEVLSDDYSTFSRLHHKLDKLLQVSNYEARLDVSIVTCDKFEDYMKNIDKLNQMVNEFKGLVAIVRGEARVVKMENQNLRKQMRRILQTLAGDDE